MKSILILSSVVLAVIGCGSGITEPEQGGAFHLVSVNGSLPAVVYQSATETREVVQGTAAITRDGNWGISLYERIIVGQTVTAGGPVYEGTWTQTKNGLSLRDSSDGSEMTAVFEFDSFTVVKNGLTLVFKRDTGAPLCTLCL